MIGELQEVMRLASQEADMGAVQAAADKAREAIEIQFDNLYYDANILNNLALHVLGSDTDWVACKTYADPQARRNKQTLKTFRKRLADAE